MYREQKHGYTSLNEKDNHIQYVFVHIAYNVKIVIGT